MRNMNSIVLTVRLTALSTKFKGNTRYWTPKAYEIEASLNYPLK